MEHLLLSKIMIKIWYKTKFSCFYEKFDVTSSCCKYFETLNEDPTAIIHVVCFILTI